MMRRGRSLLLWAALCTSGLPAWAEGARPAEKDQRAGAQKTFEAGGTLFDSKHYEQALAAFRASYQIVASPNSHLMIARCLRELGRNAEAYREYDAVAAEATRGGERYRSSGQAATEERDELKSKIALLTVRVANATPDVVVHVGDTTLPAEQVGSPVPFDPGAVVVTAESPSGASAHAEVTLTAGAPASVELNLQKPVEAAPAPAPPPVVATAPPPSSPGPPPLRTWSYVAGGVGVAGFVVFGVFGAMTASKYSSLEQACPDKRCPPGKQGDVDAGKTDQLIANVGLGVGIAGLAAGATLFLLSSGRGEKSVALRLGPGSATMSGRF